MAHLRDQGALGSLPHVPEEPKVAWPLSGHAVMSWVMNHDSW
jgi:hypothetical protein